jgi:hypothetical protein
MNPSKLVREAGFDTSTKERRAAYQAIKRWSEGREAKGQEEKPAKGKPAEKKRGEYFPRHLKLEYREILFDYVKTNHWTEYIKPMPSGETWITLDELIFWLADWNRSGQSGQPVQKWTGDMGKLFDEAFGEVSPDE